MSTFVNAVVNQEARTVNGMKARKGTASKCVTLFYKIGAMRGKDITKDFVSAYVENPELALRIAAWVRDARGGAGERQIFRDILKYLDKHNAADAVRLMNKAPELGRWDDVFAAESDELKHRAFSMIQEALEAAVTAKHLLEKIDFMSEEECQRVLREKYSIGD